MKLLKFLQIGLVIIFCTETNDAFTQKQGQQKIDSLLNVLRNYRPACDAPCLSDSSKVNLLLQLGKEFAFVKYDTALIIANEALNISEQITWKQGLAGAFHFIGYLYYLKGQYALAEENYLKSLEKWIILEKEVPANSRNTILTSKSKTLGNLGIIYVNQGQYLKGLDYYYNSLKIDETLGNKSGISKNLISIGLVYSEQKESKKALDYYFKAVAIEGENGNKSRLSDAYGNIGEEYANLENYEKSLQYHFKALGIFTEIGDQYKIAASLSAIGGCYGKQEILDSSKIYLSKALELSAQNGDIPLQAQILSSLGNIAIIQKDFDEAIRVLTLSLTLADSVQDISLQRTVYEQLSNVYAQQNDYKKAFQYYNSAMIAKDSLFNNELTKKITQNEMNYQFTKEQDSIKTVQDNKDILAKREAEKQKLIRNSIIGGSAAVALIGFLGFVNFRNKRKREKAELYRQVSETEMKALRAQMNPHFIFNALGSIDSFLLNNNPTDANNYLLKYKQLMRLILENSQHKEVSLKEDMEALELYMQLESIRLDHPFTYQFYIDKTINIEETTIPPLILQPFIENAIWHGLQLRKVPGGHIDISIQKQNDILICTVEDNGVGRQINKQSAQYSIKKESLGMKLTEERLKIINELKKVKAYFKITDLFTIENKPAGTKVELSLPLM